MNAHKVGLVFCSLIFARSRGDSRGEGVGRFEGVDFEERSHKIFVCLIFGRMIYFAFRILFQSSFLFSS